MAKYINGCQQIDRKSGVEPPQSTSARLGRRPLHQLPRDLDSVGSVFVDFEGEAFAEFHATGAQQCMNRFRGMALPTDYFAAIFRVDSEFEDRALRSFHYRDVYIVGMVHKSPGDRFHQFFHVAPPRETAYATRERPET